MSGTVAISRGLFSSEAFRDEPLTEREAWVWMVMEASWKDRTVRAGDFIADTKRGQLAASVRYMAKAWKWTPAKAQRYLKRLEKLKMIRVETDTGVSVISICKYDEYQSGGKGADTGPIQDRYRTDTKKKKDERQKEEGNTKSVPFAAFWEIWPAKKNRGAAEKAWIKLLDPDRSAAIAAVAGGWFHRWQLGSPRASPIHASTYLNNRRWTDEAAPDLRTIDGGRYDNRTGNTGPSEARGHRPDPALEQIAKLAGLGGAPGNGGV